jgi:hypothetical protein
MSDVCANPPAASSELLAVVLRSNRKQRDCLIYRAYLKSLRRQMEHISAEREGVEEGSIGS